MHFYNFTGKYAYTAMSGITCPITVPNKYESEEPSKETGVAGQNERRKWLTHPRATHTEY